MARVLQDILDGYEGNPLLLHLIEKLYQQVVLVRSYKCLVGVCVDLGPLEDRKVTIVVLNHELNHVLGREAGLNLRLFLVGKREHAERVHVLVH